MPRWRRVGKEAAWVVVGQMVAMLGGIVGVKLLTVMLPQAEYGMVALGTTIVGLATVLVFGPLGQGLLRFWSTCRAEGRLPELYRLARNWGVVLGGATLGLAVAGAIVVGASYGWRWAWVVALSCLAATAAGWVSLRQALLLAAQRQRDVAILQAGLAVFRGLLAAALVVLFARRAEWALSGQIVAAGIMLVIGEWSFRKLVASDALRGTGLVVPSPGRLPAEVKSYAWPFAVWGLFGWIHSSGDRWILQAYEGRAVVAGYSVVSQLALFPLVAISGVLFTFGLPIAFARRHAPGPTEQTRNAARRILWWLVIAYVVLATVTVLIYAVGHAWIVRLVSDAPYVPMSSLLPGLTVAWGLFYLGQMLSQFGMLDLASAQYIPAKIGAAGLLAGSGIPLCAWFGPSGLLWAVAIAGAAYAGWCGVLAWRRVQSEVL